METVIQGSTLQTLRAGLRGTAHAPGEEGYEEASRAWNLAAHQSPALVVLANGAADAYAPEDFERLVALKDRYDPHNVFRFNRNIAPSKAEH